MNPEAAVAAKPRKKKAAKPAANKSNNQNEEIKPFVMPPPGKSLGTHAVEIKSLARSETQNRVHLDDDAVIEYSAAHKDALAEGRGCPFPPGKAVRSHEGKVYPYDGFHRIESHKKNKQAEMEFDLIAPPDGWEAEAYAQLLALGVNDRHGVRPTNRDKQWKVKQATKLYPTASNVQLALITATSEGMVRQYRPASSSTVRVVTRRGKSQTMDTSRIGKKGGKKGADGAGSINEAQTNAHVIRICGAQSTEKEQAGLRDWFRRDSNPLSKGEIADWAGTSPERIRAITPLVLDCDMKPAKAFTFIDRNIEDSTKVVDLVLLLMAGQKRKDEVPGAKFRIADFGDLNDIPDNERILVMRLAKK